MGDFDVIIDLNPTSHVPIAGFFTVGSSGMLNKLLTTVIYVLAVVWCNLRVGTGALPPLIPVLVRRRRSSYLVLCLP